jgi:hypothetical protein
MALSIGEISRLLHPQPNYLNRGHAFPPEPKDDRSAHDALSRGAGADASGVESLEFSMELSIQRFQASFRLEDSVRGQIQEGSLEYESISIRIDGRISQAYGEGDLGERFKSLMETGIESLKDFFSPDKTAERISSFALSRFNALRPESTEAERQDYRDFIQPYVEQGYQKALGILGDLPEEIFEELEDTMQIVRSLFDDFVSGPVESDDSETAAPVPGDLDEAP